MPAETAIPLQKQETKDKLSDMKQSGENWDEFLERLTETTNSSSTVSGTIYTGSGKAVTFTAT